MTPALAASIREYLEYFAGGFAEQRLGGARCRPLDIATVIDEQVTRFLAAYARKPTSVPKRPALRSRRKG